MTSPKTEWYRDDFLISTNKSLIQAKEVNAAFASDAIYWVKPMKDVKLLQKMLDNSLCFGVYDLPSSTSDIAGRKSPRQIGLARLITDEVSFAWLTDVYILDEFQGKGLGTWLIKCVDECLSSWPELRRAMLITTSAGKLYEEKLGMRPFQSGTLGLEVWERKGAGSALKE